MYLGCGVESEDRNGMKWVKFKTSIPETWVWLKKKDTGIRHHWDPNSTVNQLFDNCHFSLYKPPFYQLLGIIKLPHVVTTDKWSEVPSLTANASSVVLPCSSHYHWISSLKEFSTMHMSVNHGSVAWCFKEYSNCKPSFKL